MLEVAGDADALGEGGADACAADKGAEAGQAGESSRKTLGPLLKVLGEVRELGSEGRSVQTHADLERAEECHGVERGAQGRGQITQVLADWGYSRLILRRPLEAVLCHPPIDGCQLRDIKNRAREKGLPRVLPGNSGSSGPGWSKIKPAGRWKILPLPSARLPVEKLAHRASPHAPAASSKQERRLRR